jgi:hypothetical protein
MDAETIKNNLRYFTGTEKWHVFNPLAKNYLLTDGALYLAANTGGYWLMDLIASYRLKPKVKAQPFQVWTLTVNNERGLVICTDGNDNELARQEIGYTDFPLEEIKLYCEQADEKHWVILLPGEH